MTVTDLLNTAQQLEDRIATANDRSRIALQPEFHQVLHKLRKSGAKIPQRLRTLDAVLCEEAVEAQFDNMPV